MLIIGIRHKIVDGAHFFTAADTDAEGKPFPIGLCMAHSDYELALSETRRCVETLLRLNHEIADPFEMIVIDDA